MKLTELNKVFSVSYGNKLDLNKMTILPQNSPHSVAFVVRTRNSNGVVAYVEQMANVNPYDKGLITVALGGSVLSSFLQPTPFYTAQNVAVLTPMESMNDREKMYYCNAITSNAYRYSTCGREANKTLKMLLIPARAEIPEWTNEISIPSYNNISDSINKNVMSLDVQTWKLFRYDSLFTIERGKGTRKQDLEDGAVPFVTSTDRNNGIAGFTNHVPTHKANSIGVNRNGSVAEAFYHEKAFCSTEDVHILNALNFEMNKYLALFLITLIRQEKYRYSYGRKWGIDRMKKSEIKLPVKDDGTPDFVYIENFIKSLPYSSNL